MTAYDATRAGAYWGVERFETARDQLAAVLGLNWPPQIAVAYARWETSCVDRAIPGLVGASVVDVGCGVGRVLVWLAGRCAHVDGVDVAEGMLHRARTAVESAGVVNSVTLRRASADALPLASSTSDAIVCLGLFEHLPSEVRLGALDEFARVLRPGGRLVLVLSNARSVLLGGARSDNPYRLGRQLNNGYFCELVEPWTIRRELESRGFECAHAGANPTMSLLLHAARLYPALVRPLLDFFARLACLVDGRLGRCLPSVRLADQVVVLGVAGGSTDG